MRKTLLFSTLAILFQISIIVYMVTASLMPLITGKEIVLRTVPIDPRDLLRGDYVVLNYSFNRLGLDSIKNDIHGERYKFGDELYIELEQKDNYYEPVGLWKNPPENKTFMKVIVKHFYGADTYGFASLSGGIESYYTDSETARALERNAGGVSAITEVYVMIAPDGQARIKDVKIKKQTPTPTDTISP